MSNDTTEQMVTTENVTIVVDPYMIIGVTQIQVVFESFLLLLIISVAFSANASLWLVVMTTRDLRTESNMLILCLSLADLLVSVVGAPITVASIISSRWLFSSAVCTFIGYLNMLTFVASVQSLAVISINRYFKICRPSIYLDVYTFRNAGLMFAGVWLYSSVLSIPPLIGWASYDFLPLASICFCNWGQSFSYAIFMILMCFCVPCVAMIICYVAIIRAFLRSRKAVQAFAKISRKQRELAEAKRRFMEQSNASQQQAEAKRRFKDSSNGSQADTKPRFMDSNVRSQGDKQRIIDNIRPTTSSTARRISKVNAVIEQDECETIPATTSRQSTSGPPVSPSSQTQSNVQVKRISVKECPFGSSNESTAETAQRPMDVSCIESNDFQPSCANPRRIANSPRQILMSEGFEYFPSDGNEEGDDGVGKNQELLENTATDHDDLKEEKQRQILSELGTATDNTMRTHSVTYDDDVTKKSTNYKGRLSVENSSLAIDRKPLLTGSNESLKTSTIVSNASRPGDSLLLSSCPTPRDSILVFDGDIPGESSDFNINRRNNSIILENNNMNTHNKDHDPTNNDDEVCPNCNDLDQSNESMLCPNCNNHDQSNEDKVYPNRCSTVSLTNKYIDTSDVEDCYNTERDTNIGDINSHFLRDDEHNNITPLSNATKPSNARSIDFQIEGQLEQECEPPETQNSHEKSTYENRTSRISVLAHKLIHSKPLLFPPSNHHNLHPYQSHTPSSASTSLASSDFSSSSNSNRNIHLTLFANSSGTAQLSEAQSSPTSKLLRLSKSDEQLNLLSVPSRMNNNNNKSNTVSFSMMKSLSEVSSQLSASSPSVFASQVKRPQVKQSQRALQSQRRTREEFQLAGSLLIVIFIFIICWFPYCISMFVSITTPDKSTHALEITSLLLGYMNSCVNPIVYGLMNKRFKRGYRLLFGKCLKYVLCGKRAKSKIAPTRTINYVSNSNSLSNQ